MRIAPRQPNASAAKCEHILLPPPLACRSPFEFEASRLASQKAELDARAGCVRFSFCSLAPSCSSSNSAQVSENCRCRCRCRFEFPCASAAAQVANWRALNCLPSQQVMRLHQSAAVVALNQRRRTRPNASSSSSRRSGATQAQCIVCPADTRATPTGLSQRSRPRAGKLSFRNSPAPIFHGAHGNEWMNRPLAARRVGRRADRPTRRAIPGGAHANRGRERARTRPPDLNQVGRRRPSIWPSGGELGGRAPSSGAQQTYLWPTATAASL